VLLENPPFFLAITLALLSENAQELEDKRGVLVVKWREAVVMGAVVLA
jgi:hypothetical protein